MRSHYSRQLAPNRSITGSLSWGFFWLAPPCETRLTSPATSQGIVEVPLRCGASFCSTPRHSVIKSCGFVGSLAPGLETLYLKMCYIFNYPAFTLTHASSLSWSCGNFLTSASHASKAARAVRTGSIRPSAASVCASSARVPWWALSVALRASSASSAAPAASAFRLSAFSRATFALT